MTLEEFWGLDEARGENDHARLLTALVNASREFIGIADLQGRALFVNEAGRKLVGLPDLEAVRSTQVIEYFAIEDQPRVTIARREIDMVAAWSVDRLGRSLKDLVSFLEELKAKRCDLYLHQQGLDTSTPSGEAMFGMLGIFAQFRACDDSGTCKGWTQAGQGRRHQAWTA